MAFNPELLAEYLEEAEGSRPPARYLVAFSGGRDSTVLLHALCACRGCHGVPIVAVHVNHQLQEAASLWEESCRRFAADCGVPFISSQIALDRRAGNLEARAREARYAALKSLVQSGDSVLTAHHEEDQAETLILNLLRGSGAAGLAAIGAVQAFGEGRLVRPLLRVPREDLAEYAQTQGLSFIEDPSNDDVRFDRNYLRRDILPVLRRRWPGAPARLRRSAELLAEAAELLTDLASLDLTAVGGDPARLSVEGLLALPEARQRNLLRHAIRRIGVAPAPATRLQQAIAELLPARADAEPLVRWPGGEMRRYRGTLYILPEPAAGNPPEPLTLRPDGTETRLGAELGALTLEGKVSGGIAPERVVHGLSIRFRQGGEKFRPSGDAGRRALKKLLQEKGVVPWMRQRIPLLYADDMLVAVGDLWIAEEASCASGYAVRWKNRPALF